MPTVKASRVKEGSHQAQGAVWDGKGTNFSVFSAHARPVEVCLFDAAGERELDRLTLPEYTDGFWHGYVPDVSGSLPAPGSVERSAKMRAATQNGDASLPRAGSSADGISICCRCV